MQNPKPLSQDSEDLVRRNLEAFSRYRPEIFSSLVNIKTTMSQLVDTEDGDKDIEFQGARLYKVGAKAYSESQLLDPLPHSTRITLAPPRTAMLDHIAGAFVHDLLKASVDDGITLLQRPNTEETFHLIVLGVGLGYHLDALIEREKPATICLIEPNLEFLYHSLATYDWEKLLERFTDQPWALNIIVSDTPEYIAHEMRNHSRSNSPSHVDWLHVFQHYPNNGLQQGKETFLRDAHLLPTGLGFLEDEIEMIRASYYNLKSGSYWIYKQPHLHLKTPVFVIGSGPSIDADLDFIYENQHRAIIISCGSALGVLLQHGIRPDFQMQMENGEPSSDLLRKVGETFSLDGITLVASTTVSPNMKALFQKVVFFFRKALSSYMLFSPGMEYTVGEVGPTVTNLGLSFALEMGCREVYLLGVDLGSRLQNVHHSRHSPYTQDGAEGEYMKGEAVKFNASFARTERANFGGIVYTEDTFLWSKDVFERLIRHYQTGRSVFNCSDGVAIAGAVPKVSDAIELSSEPQTKARDLAAVLETFTETVDTGEDRNILDREQAINSIMDLANRLIAACENEPDFRKMSLLMVGMLVTERKYLPKFEEHLLRGSLLLMFICIDFYEKRVHPPTKRDTFQQHARTNLIKYINNMTKEVSEFITGLD